MKEILSLLWALAVTGIILAAAYWFTRNVVGRLAAGRAAQGRQIAVLEQVPVGKDQKLLLARMGGRLYFLAASPGGIQILRELSEEEAAPRLEAPAPPAAPDSFVQAMRRVLEQKK